MDEQGTTFPLSSHVVNNTVLEADCPLMKMFFLSYMSTLTRTNTQDTQNEYMEIDITWLKLNALNSYIYLYHVALHSVYQLLSGT